MMKKFFYIFLILNLIIQIPVFAKEMDPRKRLLLQTKDMYKYIEEEISNGCGFDDSLKDLVKKRVVLIVGADQISEQLELLKTAAKNTSKFKRFENICEHYDDVSDVLRKAMGELLEEFKKSHPGAEVKIEKTVLYKTELESVIPNGGGSGVFASSMIEGDTVRPKQNESDYDRLKSDNEQLRTKNNLLSMFIESLKNEKSELMDRQVELSAENGGLKAENNGLKEKVTNFEKLVAELKEKIVNLERDMEESKSLNGLYEQVVNIYRKIIKSNKDFEQIIKLMKQIEGKRYEK